MKFIKYFFSILLLTGCQGIQDQYVNNPDQMIGMTEKQLIQRFGNPDQIVRSNDQTFISYRFNDVMQFPTMGEPSYSPDDIDSMMSPMTDDRGTANEICQIVFTLFQNKVDGFGLSSGCPTIN